MLFLFPLLLGATVYTQVIESPLFLKLPSNSHFEKIRLELRIIYITRGKRSESRIRRIALISRILVTFIIANNLIRPIFEPTFRTLNCHRSKKPVKQYIITKVNSKVKKLCTEFCMATPRKLSKIKQESYISWLSSLGEEEIALETSK